MADGLKVSLNCKKLAIAVFFRKNGKLDNWNINCGATSEFSDIYIFFVSGGAELLCCQKRKLGTSGYVCLLLYVNPFNPKLIMQILPSIQEENDWVM